MKKLIFPALLAISSMLPYTGSAQITQYWDNNGTSVSGSGNWDTNSSFWNLTTNLATATPVPFTNGNFAAFSIGDGILANTTITVPGIVTCTGIGDGVPSGTTNTILAFNGAGPINFPSGAMWNIDCGAGANTLVFNVPLTGAGGISQHNAGSMSLYGNNTYTGGTAETGGQIINYNNNNSFGTGVITNSGGNAIYLCTNSLSHLVTLANAWSLNIGSASIWDFGDGNTTLTGPVALYTTTQIKNNGASGTPLTISGPITNVGGIFGITFETPNGSSIILGGSNTYAGQTAIGLVGATASVTVSNINSVTTPAQQPMSSLGVPSSSANGVIQLGSTTGAGRLVYVGPGETTDRGINLSGTTGGGMIEMDGAGPLIFTAAFTATGSGVKNLVLSGTSTAANAINGAIVNSASATSLIKNLGGTWDLGGLNTFTGFISISNGTLAVTGSGDLGNSGGNGTYSGFITNAGTMVFNSSANQTLNNVMSGAGSLQEIGAGTLTLNGTNTYTGTTTVGNGSTLNLNGLGKIAGTGPVVLNGTLNVNSTDGFTISGMLSGSGAFNLTASSATSDTINNLNNTFSGLYTINAGTLAFNGDGCFGMAPGSFVANAITMNGGAAGNLRINTNGLTINAYRGISLGANGGCIQVAGNDTGTYSGFISGSGPLQIGVNSSTGLGVFVLGAAQPYTNYTVLAAGTLRLTLGASLGNSAGIIMSNTATLDVSTQSMFQLSTTNTFTAIGSTNTTPTILGASSGSVNFESQPIFLSFTPTLATGDPTNEALIVSQAGLVLNGNTVNVTNASALTLGIGNYALIQCTNGFTISSPLTLNLQGPVAANTTQTLVVIGNTLVLQVAPTGSYTGSQFTNLPASQSVPYGTSTATFSGTVMAAGPTYPAMNETVTITVPNMFTNTVAFSDNTGDFSVAVPVNTVWVNSGVVTYFYPGTNSTLAPTTDSSTTFTITKAPLTVTANDQIKTYGQTIPAGAGQTAFTPSGLQNSETIGTVSLAFSGSPIAGNVSNAPAFTYAITPSAAAGGTFTNINYTITYVAGTLTVNPLPVGLVGTNLYNGTAAAPFSALFITNKVVATDAVTAVSGSVTLAGSSVGIQPITSASGLTLGGAQATNYTIVGAIGSVMVNPLPIGLTGTNTYDGTTTAVYNNLSITNVQGSDDVSLASGSATFAASAAGVEPITSASGLTLGGTTAGNYTLIGAVGSVTVNPLPIGLTGTRIYDGTATAVFSILSITNIVGLDNVNLTAGSATLAASAVGVEPITSATGLTLGGAQAADYTTTSAMGAVTITSNPNPTPIGFSVSSGVLTLTWPLDHTGWTLQAQTNTVSDGIGSNWADVSGSSTTNQVMIPVDLNQGCVFYRLYFNP